jgi:hypothetical protein
VHGKHPECGTPLSRAHSFTITLSNNRTEKEAVEHLRVHDPRVVVPDRKGRDAILEYFDVPRRLSRAFDAILLPDGVHVEGALPADLLPSIDLVEVKATKKRLRNPPYGFFFGATANEFELAELLQERFRFCFVCLNPASFGVCYLTLAELSPLVRSKRIQYQINLVSNPSEQTPPSK